MSDQVYQISSPRQAATVDAGTPWLAVYCLSLLTFVIVSSEFLPVSLLTPIAQDLGVSEGQAGQAISTSGLFAIATSLFGNSALSRLDRRSVVVFYTAVLIVSGVIVTFAPNYPVFMIGRALIGVTVGGFWSLSTAILARLATRDDLPKAITMLQGGTALATVIAAPLGSLLGGLVGWRGAFFIVVPIGLIGITWQLLVLPKLPPSQHVSTKSMFSLFGNRLFALGMVATTLAFMGNYASSTYFRPLLESVAGLDITTLSLVLLCLGAAGLIGTVASGVVVKSHLNTTLVLLPALLGILALALVHLGTLQFWVAALLIGWGLFAGPIAVAWNTWMAQVIPDQLEAGGGLQVALIQFAITFGAFTGGALFDATGWSSPFYLGAALLAASAIFASITVTAGKTASA